MKKQFLIALAGAAIVVASSHAQAQTGTQFFPGNTGGTGAQNPDGSYVHPSGLAQDGNPNQFSVGGTIAEYIEITALDDKLEFGNLGDPGLIGTATTFSANSASGALTKNTSETTTSPSLVGENGTARVESQSNSYINIVTSYGPNLLNQGPNTSSAVDDYTLPTSFRYTAKGLFKLGTNPGGVLSTYTAAGGYGDFSTAAASNSSSQITFAPGYNNGLKLMAQAERNGLNDYKGTYATTVGLSYFKF